MVTDLKKFLETKKLERAEKLKTQREENLQFSKNLSNNHTQQLTHSAPETSRGEPSTSQTKPEGKIPALPRDLDNLCGILPLDRDCNRADSSPIEDSEPK